jgi:hypothetical protein
VIIFDVFFETRDKITPVKEIVTPSVTGILKSDWGNKIWAILMQFGKIPLKAFSMQKSRQKCLNDES